MRGTTGHPRSLVWASLVLVFAVSACVTPKPGAFQCINDGDCPPGCTCEAGLVPVVVCESDSSGLDCGGSCDRESACPEGTDCVLDRVEGEVEIHACKAPVGGMGGSGGAGGMGGGCVPDFTDVGGPPGNPVIWEEKFTCVNASRQCFGGGASDNNEPITFQLVQDGKGLRGTVQTGQGEGDVFEGELCGNEFRWVDVTPGVLDPERGCWTFTSDSFNKRSFVTSEFDCIGAGTKGEGSTPPDVLSCEALGAELPVSSDCPPAPPAAPEDDPL